jgi:hypothetical protein
VSGLSAADEIKGQVTQDGAVGWDRVMRGALGQKKKNGDAREEEGAAVFI